MPTLEAIFLATKRVENINLLVIRYHARLTLLSGIMVIVKA